LQITSHKKMKLRQIFTCYLTIVVAVLFTPQSKTFAQQNPSGCQATLYQISLIEGKISDITPSEVIDDPDFVEQVGSGPQEQLLAAKVPIKSSITHDLPRFWQMRVNNSDLPSLSNNNAKYKVITDNKSGNPFNKVDAKPINIQQITTCPDNTVVVEGGLRLVFSQLSQLASGMSNAQIEVCVPANNNQCP
jgi:hypothetical protein